MNIYLYRTPSDKRVVSKTLENQKLYEGVRLIANSSIQNPQIIFDMDGFDKVSDFSDYNYMRIPQFNRYYFIEEISVDRNKMIIKASVDVLMSFKDDILARDFKQLVSRQEHKKNSMLVDSYLPRENKPLIIGKEFGGDIFGNTLSYLLTTQGSGGN